MKFFTFEELISSTTAKQNGISNVPNATESQNLETLVDYCLDPIRAEWGKPITVSSGFRCTKLNTKIGGSKTSEHTKGMAADISAGDKTQNKALFEMIRNKGFAFRQLIDEKNYQWIHISYNPNDLKRQVMRYNGRTYTTISTGPTAHHTDQKPYSETEKQNSTTNTKKKTIIFSTVALVVILGIIYIKHSKLRIYGRK